MNQENKDWMKDLVGRVESPGFREEYWQAMEKKMDSQSHKRKKAAVWFILLFVSLGAMFTTLFMRNSRNTLLMEHQAGIHQQILQNASHTDKAHQAEITQKDHPHINKLTDRHAVSAKKLSKAKDMDPLLVNPVDQFENSMEDVLYRLAYGHLHLFVPGQHEQESLQTVPGLVIRRPELKKKPEGQLSFDLATGVQWTTRRISPLSSSENTYSAGRRKNEEHAKLFVSPRLQVEYRHKNGLLVIAGLEYSRYGESVAYRPYSMQQDISKVFSYQYDSVPVYSFITRSTRWENDTNMYISYDTSMREKPDAGIGNHRRATSVAYLEIPLSLGYAFDFNRYSLSFRTGVSFGFLNSRSIRGQYLNGAGTALTDLTSEQQYFKTKIDNYHLQFRLNARLDKHIGVYIEPSFRMNMSYIYTNTYLRQKYMAYGTYLGLTYTLD